MRCSCKPSHIRYSPSYPQYTQPSYKVHYCTPPAYTVHITVPAYKRTQYTLPYLPTQYTPPAYTVHTTRLHSTNYWTSLHTYTVHTTSLPTQYTPHKVGLQICSASHSTILLKTNPMAPKWHHFKFSYFRRSESLFCRALKGKKDKENTLHN